MRSKIGEARRGRPTYLSRGAMLAVSIIALAGACSDSEPSSKGATASTSTVALGQPPKTAPNPESAAEQALETYLRSDERRQSLKTTMQGLAQRASDSCRPSTNCIQWIEDLTDRQKGEPWSGQAALKLGAGEYEISIYGPGDQLRSGNFQNIDHLNIKVSKESDELRVSEEVGADIFVSGTVSSGYTNASEQLGKVVSTYAYSFPDGTAELNSYEHANNAKGFLFPRNIDQTVTAARKVDHTTVEIFHVLLGQAGL